MIETPRLLLRPARAEDLGDIHKVFSDPQAMRYWDRPPYEDITVTAKLLSGLMNQDPETSFDLVVELDGVCIGKAGMWRTPEIGYILHPDHWGKGLAFEALSAFLPRAFERFDRELVFKAECDPRNLASGALLRKLGFRRTRQEKANFGYGDVEWCDTDYYEFIRPELRIC
ncbi:Spermidine N(1)-acetyltransferase [Falsiruegeria litorea R37]|uniref:Spermidine N(1)-acetyltransferase n=1 Tax=Falsiruegeria litorea R37 TaxID=1200284 RepID=A0A1Y5SHU9_9RHOB|nr:Spermidine N(1)-acetyltransferase [Falsiruegeria litorea R37]